MDKENENRREWLLDAISQTESELKKAITDPTIPPTRMRELHNLRGKLRRELSGLESGKGPFGMV